MHMHMLFILKVIKHKKILTAISITIYSNTESCEYFSYIFKKTFLHINHSMMYLLQGLSIVIQ